MSQLIRPVRMFFLLFQVAAPVPVRNVLPGAALLVVWLATNALTGFSPERAFTMATLAALCTHFTLRLPYDIRRLAGVLGSDFAVGITLVATIAPLAVLIDLQNILLCQRVLTVIPLGIAAIYLTGIVDRSGLVTQLAWPDPRLAPMRPALTRVALLRSLSFAFLNEAMILTLSPDLWLIYAALLPWLVHYATSALTTTVFLDHQRRV